jgi:hypothetical protein
LLRSFDADESRRILILYLYCRSITGITIITHIIVNQIQMESPLIPSSLSKRKSQGGPNHWNGSQGQGQTEGFERSHPKESKNQHFYVMVVLTLEKNVMLLGQNCAKLYAWLYGRIAKSKRKAFRQLRQYEGR